MKRNLYDGQQRGKPPKLQRSIRSMFEESGPKFVEAAGVQLQCRYCSKKFRAPQGLAAHIHMHQRAGDSLLPKSQKLPPRDVPPASSPAPPEPSPAPVIDEVRSPVKINNVCT